MIVENKSEEIGDLPEPIYGEYIHKGNAICPECGCNFEIKEFKPIIMSFREEQNARFKKQGTIARQRKSQKRQKRVQKPNATEFAASERALCVKHRVKRNGGEFLSHGKKCFHE